MKLFSRRQATAVDNDYYYGDDDDDGYDYDEDDYDDNDNTTVHNDNSFAGRREGPAATTILTKEQQQRQSQSPPGRQHQLLRKLNCGASKKDVREQLQAQQEFEIQALSFASSSPRRGFGAATTVKPEPPVVLNNWQKEQRRSSWGVNLIKGNINKSQRQQSDITRPVLITVNDGDFASHGGGSASVVSSGSGSSNSSSSGSSSSSPNSSNNNDNKNRFVVGELPRDHPSVATKKTPSSSSSPFRIGFSVRNWQQRGSMTPSKSSRGSTSAVGVGADSGGATNDDGHHHQSSHYHNNINSFSTRNRNSIRASAHGNEDLYRNSFHNSNTTTTTNGSRRDMMDNVRTAQEIARKERWRRGIELEKKMRKERGTSSSINNHIGGPIMSAMAGSSYGQCTGAADDGGLYEETDNLTADGSHTTGTGTRGTGRSGGGGGGGGGSYNGDHSRSSAGSTTEATDTDESDEYWNNGARLLGKTKGSHSYQPTQRLFVSVAEDLRIVAKMILADGTACVGTAADITSETVAGCKSG
jgi:hypothetical protein